MASVFSIGVSKITPVGFLTRLCKISQNHNVIQVAFMKRLSLHEEMKKPRGFPYWDKFFSLYQIFRSSLVMRYDENTRLIVVDGPPAVGKRKLCEQLAEQFGLLYMPAPVHEEIYVNPYNVDLRQLDSQLPLNCQSYDLERFLANPNDIRVPYFQVQYLQMRFEQYANALLHILSTGQGVVLNRCVYSDIVFMNAMHESGYVTKEEVSEYNYMWHVAVLELLRPHLVIYLDVPPELVKEKIKKKGNPHEVNSKVFTTKFLTDLETAYKEKYLKELKVHSEILIYDWSNEGNLMDVLRNIENTDLDSYKKPKLADWVFNSVSDIYEKIVLYQDKTRIINVMYDNMEVPPPRLYWTSEENEAYDTVLNNHPSEKYQYGYNPQYGDKILVMKREKPQLHLFRRSARDFVNRDISKLW